MTMNKHTLFLLDMKLILSVLLSLIGVGVYAQLPESGVLRRTVVPSNIAVKHVSGVVIDASTGKPIVGISIKALSNERYSSMTSDDGTFTFDVPEYETTVIAEASGYSLVRCPINTKNKSVKISLYSDVFSSDYDKVIKPTQEQSIQITNLNADVSVDNSIHTSLNGTIRSVSRSGQQGLGSMYLLSGINSLVANSQPLVVIDGVMVNMQYDRISAHDGFYNNLLSNISVADIERVTVLKNGMALYGAKGGNGVLLIDTKRNKSFATKIDVDITGSFELIPTLPSVMNATDYRYYASELLGSTGTKLTEFKFLKSNKDYYYYNWYNNNTDWSKEVYRNAFTQLYGINVQGGDEVASYNLSVGYADANSTLKDFEMSRFNLRLNSDINIVYNKVDVRFDASYSDVTRNMRDDGAPQDINNTTITSIGLLGLVKSPFLSPYQYDLAGNRSNYLSDADDYLDEVLGTGASVANPSALLKYAEGNNKNLFGNRMVNLAITPVYKINRYLSASSHFAYSLVNTNSNFYTPLAGMPSITVKAAETKGHQGSGSSSRSSSFGGVTVVTSDEVVVVENIVRAMSSHANTFSVDGKLDWNRVIKEHTVHMTGGVRLYSDNYDMSFLQGYNSGNDKTPNLSTSLAYKTISGVDDKSTSLTYFALGDYNFQEKYFLSGGVSLEASSRFGSDVSTGVRILNVPWGIFPSVQGAWVLTSEPWFKPNNLVNFLKLNVGYDLSGNDDINSTASKSYFGSLRLLDNVSGIALENIGNTELQWETTKRISAGLDMSLFKDRWGIAFSVFSSKTDNLLSLKDLNYIGGVNQIWSNDGLLSNKGYDISIKYKLLNEKALKMEVGASLGHYKNVIEQLPGNQTYFDTESYGATIRSQVGSPVGLFYGYKTNGVYSTTLDANNDGKYIVLSSGEKQYYEAGDINFVTTDNLEVNEKDRTVIGDPNPDFYGSLFAKITMNRLTLNAMFNYSLGNDIFNYQRMILESGSQFYNQSTALKNRWTTEGQVTDIPIITYNDPMGNSRFSDRWIEDGSYLRLKSLTLSYAVPVSGTYLQGLTIWGAANNVFTWTKYLGSDPDNSISNNALLQGIDRGLLPQSRSFSFGLKINI
jgi:TonB-linked SusC/RagA family outer membrane protein